MKRSTLSLVIAIGWLVAGLYLGGSGLSSERMLNAFIAGNLWLAVSAVVGAIEDLK